MKHFRFLAVRLPLLALLTLVVLAGCGGNDKATSKTTQAASAAETNTGAGSNSATEKTATRVASDIDAHPGKALHDSNCISCHDATAYTRKDRKIADFPQLLAQVRRCDANLGSRLFDEDIEQVADYLNQAYYQYQQ